MSELYMAILDLKAVSGKLQDIIQELHILSEL